MKIIIDKRSLNKNIYKDVSIVNLFTSVTDKLNCINILINDLLKNYQAL